MSTAILYVLVYIFFCLTLAVSESVIYEHGGACETQVLSNKCQASPVGECQAVEVLGQ